MLHYLLASGEGSPVFEWIERAAVFIEVLAVALVQPHAGNPYWRLLDKIPLSLTMSMVPQRSRERITAPPSFLRKQESIRMAVNTSLPDRFLRSQE